MFGVTQVCIVPSACLSSLLKRFKEGHSVLVHVTGFMPYFFIAVPRGFEEEDIDPFRADLNVRQNCPPLLTYSNLPRLSLWCPLSPALN